MQHRLFIATFFVACVPLQPNHAIAELPSDAIAFPELKLDSGTAYRTAMSVIIELDELPKDNKVNLPRMANVIPLVRWLGQGDDKPMKLHSEIDVWTVHLSKPPGEKPFRLELVTDAAPLAFDGKVVAEADNDGVISLPAKFAKTHGEKLRFEPQPHKNTVGYWTVEKDFAEWHLKVDTAAKYDVEIFQGCGKGHGGSDIEVRVGDQKVGLQVQDTGHFQNFLWRSMGQIQLPAGDDIVLKLVAVKKAGGAVMDCREIRLIPSENKDPALRREGQKVEARP
ncbi:MAG: hypothetical protein R3C59_06225 [Planctomycetaceae bacterium]